MGTTRWASGTIAGIPLVDAGGRDCRIDVIDGEPFKSIFAGNSVLALDLTVHTQVTVRAGKGIHFGLHIAQIELSTAEAIIAAMEAAVGDGDDFVVIANDAAGVDDINATCVPDYAAKMYTRGSMAAGYVKDVVFRFISTGLGD